MRFIFTPAPQRLASNLLRIQQTRFKFSFPLRGLLICMLGPRMVFSLCHFTETLGSEHWEQTERFKGACEFSIKLFYRCICKGKMQSFPPLHWATFALRDSFKNLPRTPFSPESALDFSKHRRNSPWGLLMNQDKISVGLEGFLEKGSLYLSPIPVSVSQISSFKILHRAVTQAYNKVQGGARH